MTLLRMPSLLGSFYNKLVLEFSFIQVGAIHFRGCVATLGT